MEAVAARARRVIGDLGRRQRSDYRRLWDGAREGVAAQPAGGNPGERIVFQYTTSSTNLQKKLGVA